jgi:hypothetical protein
MGALSATFGGLIRQRDELYENTNPNLDDFEDLDREAYRIALRWELNEALTVDYAYDHSKLDEKNYTAVHGGQHAVFDQPGDRRANQPIRVP